MKLKSCAKASCIVFLKATLVCIFIVSSSFLSLEARLKRRSKNTSEQVPVTKYRRRAAQPAPVLPSRTTPNLTPKVVTKVINNPVQKIVPVPATPRRAVYPEVKVLLDEKQNNSGVLWTLRAAGNFVITDLRGNHTPITLKGPQLTVGVRNGILLVNNKRVASQALRISSTQGPITYGDYAYKGTFIVATVPGGTTTRLINQVELEDYVACGVRWEMLPGWPAAALEAGAIAYRTYVTTTLRTARAKNKNKSPDELHSSYDIKSTPVHQTYKGTHACKSIYDAVQATKGLIITHRGEPIVALYDACCGGSIPSRRVGTIDFDKAPYLARGYACNYCSHYVHYAWSHTYTLQELTELLASYIRKRGPISAVKIVQKDRAGAVQEFQIKVRNEWVTVPGPKLVALAKKLRSCTLTLTKQGTTVQFKGKGDGHQYGFCQWGAHGLARKGWTNKRILQFYYPGTSLMKIEQLI